MNLSISASVTLPRFSIRAFAIPEKGRILGVAGQFPVADGLDVALGNTFRKGYGGVKRDGPRALQGNRVGEQYGLFFRLMEASSMETPKAADERTDEHGAFGHDASDVRYKTKFLLQSCERLLGFVRRRFDGMNAKLLYFL